MNWKLTLTDDQGQEVYRLDIPPLADPAALELALNLLRGTIVDSRPAE